MLLAGEERAQDEFAVQLHDDLALAADVRKLALDAIGGDTGQFQWAPIRGLNHQTVVLALGLFAKACKQHRCITVLGQLGYGSDAGILARTLFETALALQFLLKHRVVIRQGGKPLKPDPKRTLTTPFRTLLYVAHIAFEDEKRLVTFRSTPGLKPLAKRFRDPNAIHQRAQEAVKRIGTNWAKRLKDSRNYAGVSIRDLAASLRLLPWYSSIYSFQSSTVHARDAFDHLYIDEVSRNIHLRVAPELERIQPALTSGNAVLLGCTSVLEKRLGLGLDSRIDSLLERLKPAPADMGP